MASSRESSAYTTSSEIQEAALLSKSLSPRCPMEEREAAYLKVLSQSTSSSLYLRKLVGKLVPQYFTEFDALQEKAVDAIYDLCEDSEKEIRTVGYNAFEQISRVATSWVKRNTDVLIQLLQIDAEDEIVILRRLIAAHIDISISALSVVIDSLTDPEMEVGLKLILVDILTAKWKNQKMPSGEQPTFESSQAVNSEDEEERVLREGLYLTLSQSPPLALVEKIFCLLFLLPLPTTAQRITHILSYNYPSPLSTVLYTIAQQHVSTVGLELVDPRAFVRYHFEQLSGSPLRGAEMDLSQERTLLMWIKQWAERERNKTLRQDIEGDEDVWAGETKDRRKVVEGGRERWQKVLDEIVDRISSKVLPLLRSGRRDRNGLDLPFQALEPHLFILFYLSRIPSVAKRSIEPSSQLEQYINQRIGPGRPNGNLSGSVKLAQSNTWSLLDYFRAPLLNSKDVSWSKRRFSFSWETDQSSNHFITNASSSLVTPVLQPKASTSVVHSQASSPATTLAPPSALVTEIGRKSISGPAPTLTPSVFPSRPAASTHSSSSDLLQRLTPQSSQTGKDSNRPLSRQSFQSQHRQSSVTKSITPNIQYRPQSSQMPSLSNKTTHSDSQTRPHLSQREGSSTALGFSIKGRASTTVTDAVPSPLSSPAAMPSLRDRLAPSMGNAGAKDEMQNAGQSSSGGHKKRKGTGSSGGRRKR